VLVATLTTLIPIGPEKFFTMKKSKDYQEASDVSDENPTQPQPLPEFSEKAVPFDPFEHLDKLYDGPKGQPLGEKVHDFPVEKPDKIEYVMFHPTFEVRAYVLEDKKARGLWLVLPPLQNYFRDGQVKACTFYLYGTRQTDFRLYKIAIPEEGMPDNRWLTSAANAVVEGRKDWVQIISAKGHYATYPHSVPHPAPEWPEISPGEILRKAFQGRVIDRPDHPELLRVTGQTE
jgi:hypothetical protein